MPDSPPVLPPYMKSLQDALGTSSDVVQLPLVVNDVQAQLLFVKTVVEGSILQDTIIKPFYEIADTHKFDEYLHGMPNHMKIPESEEVLKKLVQGFVLVYCNGNYLLLEMRKLKNTVPLQTVLESTIHGPQAAFSEDLETNIGILRQQYHQPDLYVETMELKDISSRAIALVYDRKKVNTQVLRRLKEQLKQVDDPLIQSAGDLAIRLTPRRYNVFPVSLLTERPDRTVYNITGGKIIVIVDGSPFVIMAPVLFFDFMVSMEENYHTFFISLFNTALGWIGLMICLLLPSFYIAFASYSPEVLRTELTLSIAGSRIGVPYPTFIEVLIMLLFVELLTEASIRLPKSINATATTVGGLILGTASVEAAIASNILIITIAAVAIANFVVPINELSFAVRICRILLIVFTSLFGLIGLLSGFVFIIIHLVNLDSFGQPYLRIPWRDKSSEKEVGSG